MQAKQANENTIGICLFLFFSLRFTVPGVHTLAQSDIVAAMRPEYMEAVSFVPATLPQLEDEGVEFVSTEPKVHSNHTTIQHWQLRDLIYAPDNNTEYYYVNSNSVRCYNTERCETNTVISNLSFKPNSLVASHGYVAAGGHRSQLVVKNMTTGSITNMNVGGSINNALCISEHNQSTRLLVSNNDDTVKVFSLPSMEKVTDLPLPVAVNYVAVSGSGEQLVAVGDSQQGWLFDVRNDEYRLTQTFAACANSAFSCAWNSSGDKLAIACQGGSVSVWDVRHMKAPMVTLPTNQCTHGKGACRSVKFSQSSLADLMLYTEHDSLAHVVCARTFERRQTLRVGTSDLTGQGIGGACFTPDSSKIYIAMECGVFEFQVDLDQRRQTAVRELS